MKKLLAAVLLALVLIPALLVARAQQTAEPNPTLFSVIGNVNHPGSYQYEDGLIVRKALETAGGLTARGSLSRISILRNVDGRSQRIAVTLDSPVWVHDIVEVGPEALGARL